MQNNRHYLHHKINSYLIKAYLNVLIKIFLTLPLTCILFLLAAISAPLKGKSIIRVTSMILAHHL